MSSDFLKQKSGAAEETRTPDPIITNDVLYQLSYSGTLPVANPKTDLPLYACGATFLGRHTLL